ncbi:VOC family protein [Thermoleophilia bacterium SCSIO 60948]|nr:VOC family protein [Thermoleophilia bacterium SCSIO 60948]
MNHIALEVGDLDEAIDFYGRLFEFELRGRVGDRMAFLDMGDQFLALAAGGSTTPDEHRHFGLVVDDLDAFAAAAEREGLDLEGRDGRDFHDPWGNSVQVVGYRDVQFERTVPVKRKLGIEGVEKSEDATEEMRAKDLL